MPTLVKPRPRFKVTETIRIIGKYSGVKTKVQIIEVNSDSEPQKYVISYRGHITTISDDPKKPYILEPLKTKNGGKNNEPR